MDPDVVEIPPPVPRPPRMLKHKEVMLHDVIELDEEEEEDNVDLMLFGEVDEKNLKGKAIDFVSDGYSDHSVEEAMVNPFGLAGVEAFGSFNGVEASKTFDPAADNVINLDGQSSDASFDDDNDDIDLYSEDFMDIDEYAMLQAHFDNVDIPPGIEAPIPFMFGPPKSKKKTISGTGSSSVQTPFPIQSSTVDPPGINSSSPAWLSGSEHFIMDSISGGSSNLPIQMDSTKHPMEVDLSAPWFLSQTSQSKKKATALQHKGSAPNLPLGVASKSRWRRPFQYKKKQHNLSSSTNYDPVTPIGVKKLPSGVEPSFWEPHIPDNIKKQVGTNTFHSSSYVDISKLPSGVGPSLPWAQAPFKASFKSSMFNHFAHPSFNPPMGPAYHPQDPADMHLWFGHFHRNLKNDAVVGSSTNDVEAKPIMDKDEILRKFQLFKQFDTVEDHSDHHYTGNGSAKHSSKNWAKRIQEEWKILEKDLPDTIFVRVYESRMDLLRAVIVGAEGTPYHDGLFFFDVFFPSGYPNVPPHFEDFVMGHFFNHAHDILVACKAYMDGAQVGCLVKGGVQDVDEGDKSCSRQFQDSLAGYMNTLVKEFSQIGVEDCQKFLSPTANVNKKMGRKPQAAP
ncbi:hypothetical protein TIFTF001_014051 [Ficus carica]|uniref:UBC core domain-containing protein n=1 Tax=Ficus carica TaxID=3494 RepID=A0AA88A351_FICCA|nr:hypothetical protein TIFTF001_014051 [Ficus carica]